MPHRTHLAGLAAILGFGLVGLAQPALAADLDYGYGDAPPPEAEQKVEFGSGWYIRGDIGVGHGFTPTVGAEPYDNTPVHYDNGTAQGFNLPAGIYEGPGQTPPTILNASTNALSYNASIGGGYQFNKWFRMDATVDVLQPHSTSRQGYARDCITGETPVTTTQGVSSEVPVVASCTPTLSAGLKSYAALINGYVDLGTYGIVTPYVGAGVGLSFGHAQASATYIMNNGVSYNINYTDPLNGATYHQDWDRQTSKQYYTLAFALMAGISVDVFDHTKLDIGYRYLDLGRVLGTHFADNEVRAGLRYMIDN